MPSCFILLFISEARTSRYASLALIIISAPLPFPNPVSLSCLQSQSTPGCRSLRTCRRNAYYRWELGTTLDSIQFSESHLKNKMKSYNVISRFELVTQVYYPDRPITQPTFFLLLFFSSTWHRLHQSAYGPNVLLLQCFLVACIICPFFSSSIKFAYTAVEYSGIFKG